MNAYILENKSIQYKFKYNEKIKILHCVYIDIFGIIEEFYLVLLAAKYCTWQSTEQGLGEGLRFCKQIQLRRYARA